MWGQTPTGLRLFLSSDQFQKWLSMLLVDSFCYTEKKNSCTCMQEGMVHKPRSVTNQCGLENLKLSQPPSPWKPPSSWKPRGWH